MADVLADYAPADRERFCELKNEAARITEGISPLHALRARDGTEDLAAS
jgi:hypothetical protein